MIFNLTLSGSSSLVKVMCHSSRSREENCCFSAKNWQWNWESYRYAAVLSGWQTWRKNWLLNPFHTTDSDPTKLFCRVWSAVWTRFRN